MKKIPQMFLDEFLNTQIMLIKNRVQLTVWIFITAFLGGTAVTSFVIMGGISFELMITWVLMIFVCGIVLVAVTKAYTLVAVKLSALLLVALLLIVLVGYHIVESAPPFQALILYLIMLFVVIFTIPWLPKEIIYVALLHFGAFSVYFLNVSVYIYKNQTLHREPLEYLQGVLLLLVISGVYFVVSRREYERRVENYMLLKEIELKGKEVAFTSEQMQKELDLATRVHNSLIPQSMSSDLVDIAIMYLPIYYMGGDYAKFHFVDKHKLIFIICDVTGHGVSAALLVNRLHTEFERSAREGKEPGILLKELNDFITKDFEDINMYISAFCGMLDFEKKKLIYSNHGHPTQYVYQTAQDSIQSLSSQTSLLGLPLKDDQVYQSTIDFNKGDKVLLFTDGVIEARNKDGEEYGKDRFETFIRKNNNLKVHPFNKKLVDEVSAFKHGNFEDDIFLLTMDLKLLKLSQKIKEWFTGEK